MAGIRARPRIPIAVALLATLASPPVIAATFTVDSTVDLPDASPGDGSCAAVGGACTLRAAVQEANALRPSRDTVVLPAGTYTLTIPPNAADYEGTGSLT
jgi:CSLREA domain-containing protein